MVIILASEHALRACSKALPFFSIKKNKHLYFSTIISNEMYLSQMRGIVSPSERPLIFVGRFGELEERNESRKDWGGRGKKKKNRIQLWVLNMESIYK